MRSTRAYRRAYALFIDVMEFHGEAPRYTVAIRNPPGSPSPLTALSDQMTDPAEAGRWLRRFEIEAGKLLLRHKDEAFQAVQQSINSHPASR